MALARMIDLPDEYKPGGIEACEYFAKQFDNLKKIHFGSSFQFVPCSFKQMPGDNNLHVTSFMAIKL
jgi:hypothetical protein